MIINTIHRSLYLYNQDTCHALLRCPPRNPRNVIKIMIRCAFRVILTGQYEAAIQLGITTLEYLIFAPLLLIIHNY